MWLATPWALASSRGTRVRAYTVGLLGLLTLSLLLFFGLGWSQREEPWAVAVLVVGLSTLTIAFALLSYLAQKALADRDAQLSAADRMASVGTLASGVAHELNNPLAYVVGNLEYLVEEIQALPEGAVRDPEELTQASMDALHGAHRIRDIVRELGTFAKANQGRVRVRLAEALDVALGLTSNQIKHRAQLVRSCPANLAVLAEEAQLAQVFVNLLVNAAKAIPEGKREEQTIRVACSASGGRVVAEITDTGTGIADDVLPRIFEPFFTTREAGQGSGLGLSICHKIVTDLGGTIDVTSEPGVGTTVRVELPEAPLLPSARPEGASEEWARVLVVDDDPGVIRLLQRMLREHEVAVADGGRRAIELLADQEFDIVFCDLMMPDVSGIEVYEAERARHPGREGRIVFITGGAFSERAQFFVASVSNRCITKPFSVDEVKALVLRRL